MNEILRPNSVAISFGLTSQTHFCSPRHENLNIAFFEFILLHINANGAGCRGGGKKMEFLKIHGQRCRWAL